MEIEREALRRPGWDAAGDQEHLAAESTNPRALDIWASRGVGLVRACSTLGQAVEPFKARAMGRLGRSR